MLVMSNSDGGPTYNLTGVMESRGKGKLSTAMMMIMMATIFCRTCSVSTMQQVSQTWQMLCRCTGTTSAALLQGRTALFSSLHTFPHMLGSTKAWGLRHVDIFGEWGIE